jgi:opine dehydrogenase
VTEVAVIGAGNGGLAAAADLARRGHEVRLFNRSAHPIDAVLAQGGIRTSGAIGDGIVPIRTATTSLSAAVKDADVVVVVLPATAHADVAGSLASLTGGRIPLILNPGHMCGSLHVRRIFGRAGADVNIAEFGTLTYICRSTGPGEVGVYLRACDIPFAVVPPDDDLAKLVDELFPGGRRVASPLEAWFWDVNMILHPPGMVLGAARIEAAEGDFAYYAEGLTPSVAAVMRALDDERIEVANAFGVETPRIEEAMAVLGTAHPGHARNGDLAAAVSRGTANASIRAPSSLDHRYLHEDVPFGLVPLATLGRIAGVSTPVADALVSLAEAITARAYRDEGLNERVLELEGATTTMVVSVSGGGP